MPQQKNPPDPGARRPPRRRQSASNAPPSDSPNQSGATQQPQQQPNQQNIPLDQQSIAVEAPTDATKRIQEMRGDGGRPRLFSSDLSVGEFLLTREAGFEPLGVVMGSSVYHIGWQPTYGGRYGYGFGYGYTSYNDQELTVLTEAKLRARELAMSRMEAEAAALGADGVIGVRLDVGEYEWGADLAEFIAVGTAVRALSGTPGAYRTRFGKPFTSDLSGQDFRTLLHAGYRPLALTLGVCVYATYQNGIAFQNVSGWWGWGGVNQEVAQFTQAIYSARESAMGRMQAEAATLGAEGIVGTRYEMSTRLSLTDAEFREQINDQEHN
ncbi:MAG TPA: heavy metal-binding domain-containing protein, partial [Ktedonobacterales bacterium]|nr:heavy metal-binding domain-containing protein [Ktedonobacterales bacterium]